MFKRRPLGGGNTGGSGGGSGDSAQPSSENRAAPSTGSSPSPLSPRSPQAQQARPVQGQATVPSSRPGGNGRRRNRRRGRGRTGSPQGRQPQEGNAAPNAGGPTDGAQPSRAPGRHQIQGQRPGPSKPNNSTPPVRGGRSSPGRPPQGRAPQVSSNRTPSRAPVRRPIPTPPAYLQRGLVLVASTEAATLIDQVRAKFDPLVKKIPAHVTLLLPEPASRIQNSFLRGLNFEGVASLESVTFTHVEVKDERYLFLVPDEEGKARLRQWHELAVTALGEGHTQDDEYLPRLTLGYIPRSMTPDEATAFARNLLTFPMMVPFEKIMLEEFEENQLSKELDALKMSEPLPTTPRPNPTNPTPELTADNDLENKAASDQGEIEMTKVELAEGEEGS